MAERNASYPLGGLVELDDAYFGGVSHGPGKWGRGTDQDPVVVGVSLTDRGHPRYAFLDAMPNLTKERVLPVLARRVADGGVWHTDGAAVYAAGATVHQADLRVTPSGDPAAPDVFHWISTVISLAKTFIDGTYHGRGRARRPRYLEEFTYRSNRRRLGTRIAELVCEHHPYAN